jgi:HD-GYP domain-containing protein (c-di-GMP phosphodiesterase class II)
MATPSDGLRLTELLASLSLATDLVTGQPLGHGLRTCLLAVRLAWDMGLGIEDVRAVHSVSLLRFLGCTADSSETAQMAGGDDLTFNAEMAPVMNGSRVEGIRQLVKSVGRGETPITKSRMVFAALTDPGEPAGGLAAHCEVATMLAHRLGMEQRVTTALLAAYERWDGNGYPAGLEGEAIPIEIRVATVAGDVDLFVRLGADARSVVERRSGKAYDPMVVKAFQGLAGPIPEASWDEVLAAEPQPLNNVEDLDAALAVLADFADLKSPWMRGHSTKVADLAETAAQAAGLGEPEAHRVRRAGLVHDVGRVGVPNGIWDKPGPLSTDEWERVRLHSYLTHRILSRCTGLAELEGLASSHHERLDGSGYHRQATASQLSIEARLLAAADVLAAVTSTRPHREALDVAAAERTLRREVEVGRLDKQATECVIAAAGGKAESQRTLNSAGLTDREIDVLRLICRGLTNRKVGDELYISAKTVGRHVENIYAKIGVSTRAGAAVYAMEHRLLE